MVFRYDVRTAVRAGNSGGRGARMSNRFYGCGTVELGLRRASGVGRHGEFGRVIGERTFGKAGIPFCFRPRANASPYGRNHADEGKHFQQRRQPLGLLAAASATLDVWIFVVCSVRDATYLPDALLSQPP